MNTEPQFINKTETKNKTKICEYEFDIIIPDFEYFDDRVFETLASLAGHSAAPGLDYIKTTISKCLDESKKNNSKKIDSNRAFYFTVDDIGPAENNKGCKVKGGFYQ